MSATDAPDGTRTITEKPRRQKPGRAKLTKEVQVQVFAVLDNLRHDFGTAGLTAIRRYLKTLSTRTRLEDQIAAKQKELAELKAKAGVA